ncbi:pimeloyl-ACP methyl ester carboxylesterase [Pontibacter mucosus]|uniref:Pimeloyl-ACP methyl ester carboxylesterase n=1 Tax=Pontibacter mucosus TaxID=1649266 RepID=A0A2T5YED5_9BACT|nr:alpha/beta fold hydrolase [Pontibacter mucosus]PTX15084.1 pimeloyl-ACP methyl ester carboxylesterase [Pontibacter mucosus]
MKTFVLVHGSWHGSWNWHKVVPILESKGHKALAINLPGMGKDKTPIESVRMSTTVESVCSLLDTMDEKVILVGHSKNGIMISQIAEYRPAKIEKLIYLAAYLVPDGKTQREYSVQDTQCCLKPYIDFDPTLNATTLRPEIYREGLYHDCEDYIIDLAKHLLSHEPFESATVPLKLTDEKFGSVPRFYIECTEDRAVTPFIQQMMYQETPCQKVYQMNTSHSPFFSRPDALCDIFLEISLL